MARAWILGLLFVGLLGCATSGHPPDVVPAARQEVNNGADAFQRGALDTAERHYREAIRLDPDYVEGHIGLGSVLAQRGQDDEAVRSFEEAIKHDSNNSRAYAGLGVALSGLGDVQGAVAAFEKAVELSPENAEARFGLGIAYLAADEPGKALDQVRALETFNPDMAQKLRTQVSPF